MDRYPELFEDPNGDTCPIITIELDGGHGASERVTRFCGGLIWYRRDLCALHEIVSGRTSYCNLWCLNHF